MTNEHQRRTETEQSVETMTADGSRGGLSRRTALRGLGSVGALAVAGRGVRVAAQETATPGASPAAGGENAGEEAGTGESVRYQHPEKRYFYLPGFGDEATVAAVHGLDVATYREIAGRFAGEARGAAEELLGDEAFAAMVDRLPFGPGETVVGIGESDTDDLQSWLEIVRHLLALRRGGDGITVVNAGLSGQTTTEALRYFPATMLMNRPRWIICGIGTNDLVGLGRPPARTLIALAETERNLAALREQAMSGADGEIGWVWMNRWPVDEARIAAHPNFQAGQASWSNADIDALNLFFAARPEPVVDLQAVYGRPPAPELLGPDGLHPSLAGQKAAARAVVETLAG